MVKKSIADEIKKRLKSGSPVAVIAAGVMAACSGCDDNSGKVDNTPPPPPAEKQPRCITPPPVGLIEVAPREKAEVIEKIVFDDNDFNKDLSKLSTFGEKKLEEFMDGIEKKYGFLVKVKIDIADADAQRKRKKARAIFDKFSFVRYTLSGVAITPRRSISVQIVSDLNKEYRFGDEGI